MKNREEISMRYHLPLYVVFYVFTQTNKKKVSDKTCSQTRTIIFLCGKFLWVISWRNK